MDSPLKQRLIGAAVLAALAIIFLPMLLKGPDVKEPDAATVPLSMPATPGEEFETRELPLTAPEAAPAGGVLGMASGSAARPSPAAAAIPVPDGDQAALADAGPADTAAVAAAPAATTPPTTATVPPPAAKPATPMPATVGAGAYMVNIGSFGNLANANALIAKLRAANLPVRADRVALAAGSATRIRVGPYGDRAAAEAARLRADSVTAASSKVIVLDAQAEAPAKQASPAPAPLPKPVAPVVAAPTPAAASKPVATASEPARPANVSAGFAVQLSAPSVEAEANALRDRARGQGFNSFVQRIETAGGVRYRVRVGPVADRSAAASLRDAVNGKLGTKGIIVGNP
jgi:cell division septation protein DedD